MKKFLVLAVAITLMTLVLIAPSSPNFRVGDQLFIPQGTGTLYYYENVPFHLAHGWRSAIGNPANTTAMGEVRLEIDGVPIPHDFIDFTKIEDDGTEYLAKFFVFNFPAGMTGVHIFDMYYSNICSFWLERGDVTECEKPNAILEFHLKSWEVIFYEPIFVVYTPGSVEGYGWPLGKTITMNVNDGDYIAQSVSEQRPDFPAGETRVSFENWRDNYEIEPGDTVVLTDESTGVTKSHIVTPVQVTEFDVVANTISGIYDPAYGLHVFLADYNNSFPVIEYWPYNIDYNGTKWTAFFDEVDVGMTGAAAQIDADYDGTSWDFVVPPKLNLRVNYGHEWVESFYEAGHTVWITVTESDGVTVKATAELFTEPQEIWGGETGFYTQEFDWDPALPDIQPFDWVYGRVDNGAVAQVQLGDIHGEINHDDDSIQGTINAPWFSDQEVKVECHLWIVPEPPQKFDWIKPDGIEDYYCSWFDEYDFQAGWDIGPSYYGPDGHWAANVIVVP